MALANPLGKIKAVVVGSLKAPVAVVGSAVGLAKALAPKKDSPARPEPVNVTEELGLDPAPVEKPSVAKKAPKRRPVTTIDAAADPSTVDATPADVADVVAKAGPAGREPVN